MAGRPWRVAQLGAVLGALGALGLAVLWLSRAFGLRPHPLGRPLPRAYPTRYYSALAEQHHSHFLTCSPHSGWRRAMVELERAGVYSFQRAPNPAAPVLVECTAWSFLWNSSQLLQQGKTEEEGPEGGREFVAFFHVPLAPHPFDAACDLTAVLASRAFARAASSCRAALCTSEYLRTQIAPYVRNTHVVYHPLDVRGLTRFCFSLLERTVVHVGDFLRRYAGIVQLNVPAPWRKAVLSARSSEETLRKLQTDCRWNGVVWCGAGAVEVWPRVDGRQYDRLLASHVVFLQLYDASANNTVLECAARATPLLVNRHAAVEEYLGPDYPLFYDSLVEAAELLADEGKLVAAHRYLSTSWDASRFSLERFAASTAALV